MEKSLFSITCTTCQARLKVRDPEAIGAILTCPKCESMVLVTPPPGWTMPVEAPPIAPPVALKPAAVAAPVVATAAVPGKTKVAGEPVSKSPAAAESDAVSPSPATADPQPAADLDEAAAESPATGGWISLAERMGRDWMMVGALAVVALAIGSGLVVKRYVFSPKSAVPAVQPPVVESPAVVATEEKPADPPTESLPAVMDPRWLPDGARFLVRWEVSRLRGPELDLAINRWGALWQGGLGRVLAGLHLRLEHVRRLSWAATDLGGLMDNSLLVIELNAEQDAAKLLGKGKPAGLSLGNVACLRSEDPAWQHPLAILDAQTIVTGRDTLLKAVSLRAAPPTFESKTFARLLADRLGDASFSLRIDLEAARAAGWPLPVAWLDTWPAGRTPYRLVWEMSRGAALLVHAGQPGRADLWLLGEGPSDSQRLQQAVQQLASEGHKSLSAQARGLPESLRAGRFTAAEGDQYDLLLNQGAAALQSARVEAAGELVHVGLQWDQSAGAILRAGAESSGPMASDWRLAARQADQSNYRTLLDGLSGYQKTSDGQFPAGAVGATLMAPETRLSWLATLLPYLGHPDWHRQLDFSYPWNGPQNREVTRRRLEAVVNPALGESQSEAGFPVTHYVGVAGVGPDAGRLPEGDPRAGVFGYARSLRLQDISDGASNTIAILGVARQEGPWAAGGKATVRALTARPYVNGPDGFGSGQPDGMLAGMADGSIRFISKDVDPTVLEQLATARGGEKVGVALLEPKANAPVAADRPAQEERPPQTPAGKLAGVKTPEPDLGEVPAPPRGAAPEIDLEPLLATTLPQIQFRDTPLVDALRLLGDLGGVPITVDPDAMQAMGLSLGHAIRVDLRGAILREVLNTVAGSCGLTMLVDEDQILLTSPSDYRQKLVLRSYPVVDLTKGDAAAAKALAQQVRQLVAPEAWKEAGGPGALTLAEGQFRVEQTGEVHDQVLSFLERLRQVRKLPVQSPRGAERFPLQRRLDRAAVVLNRPVTVNFPEATPVVRILRGLEEAAQIKILVDWSAAGSEGLAPTSTAALRADRQPLGAALDNLLRPMRLGSRVAGDAWLQVVSRKALANRMDLEFYPVAELVSQGIAPNDLIERIQGGMAKATWNDAGGPGALQYDEPSRCLLVLQSQPVHAALGKFLADAHAETAGKK